MKKQINEMLVTMREEATLCNVNANSYDNLFTKIQKLNRKELKKFKCKLSAIYYGAFVEQKKARNAVTPEIWRYYILMEVRGLWEQNNLVVKSKDFRTVIRSLINETTKPKRDAALAEPVSLRRKQHKPDVANITECP